MYPAFAADAGCVRVQHLCIGTTLAQFPRGGEPDDTATDDHHSCHIREPPLPQYIKPKEKPRTLCPWSPSLYMAR
jgi:hypothetical protein